MSLLFCPQQNLEPIGKHVDYTMSVCGNDLVKSVRLLTTILSGFDNVRWLKFLATTYWVECQGGLPVVQTSRAPFLLPSLLRPILHLLSLESLFRNAHLACSALRFRCLFPCLCHWWARSSESLVKGSFLFIAGTFLTKSDTKTNSFRCQRRTFRQFQEQQFYFLAVTDWLIWRGLCHLWHDSDTSSCQLHHGILVTCECWVLNVRWKDRGAYVNLWFI